MPTQSGPEGHILVVGCSAGASSCFGIGADQIAITSQHISATTVTTATAAYNGQQYDVIPTPTTLIQNQITSAMAENKNLADQNERIVKIGAIHDQAALQVLEDALSQSPWTCIVDMEPLCPAPQDPSIQANAMASAFLSHILPYTTVLCASIDDALLLLDAAGAPVPPPRGIPDIKLLGIALCHLFPSYVVLKQEFLDEADQETTLLYVLCGPHEEPVYDRLRCQNLKLVRGASYSVAAAVAARLAKGDEVEEAVPAAFAHLKDMLQNGMIPKEK